MITSWPASLVASIGLDPRSVGTDVVGSGVPFWPVPNPTSGARKACPWRVPAVVEVVAGVDGFVVPEESRAPAELQPAARRTSAPRTVATPRLRALAVSFPP